MTSEGPHRPGQEPDEAPPGGGPAPYGDRSAQPDGGYGATAPDLGWAPPPPARPDAPAPSWANQQGTQWGSAQATRQADSPPPGNWDQAQQQWPGQAEQAPPAWATPAAQSTPDQPAWATGGQPNPAWGAPATSDAPQQPEWTPQQPAPHQPTSGQPDWATAQPTSGQPTSGPANGWGAGQQPEWATTPRGDDHTPGWAATATPPEPAQPDWAPADPPAPVRAEPPARATAQVPTPNLAPHQPGVDEPGRPGAWQPEQQEQPAWATGQQREPAAGWPGDQQAESWHPGGDRPAQPDWATPHPEAPADWAGTRAAAEERPQWSTPPQEQSAPAWAPSEPATGSARPTDAGPPPTWAPGGEPLPSRTAADRPGLTDVQPWAPGEAWGNSGAAEAGSDRADVEPATGRAGDAPIYQPAPAPGISPNNMLPLPPQEQRVPGASLAAGPPADYGQPAAYGVDQSGPTSHPGDQQGGGVAWGQPEPRYDDPQASAAPVIPAPRTSPEADWSAPPTAAAGGVSASASVPLASRVTPPADHPPHPAGPPAPQSRVYGRPARSESGESTPERDEPPAPRFDQNPEPHFADHEPPAGGPGSYSGSAAPGSPAAPPAFPAGMPSFADSPPTNRPVNGTKPHPEPERPADPFGGPPGGDRFGGHPGGDPFGGPGAAPSFGGAPGDRFGGQGNDPFGGPPGGDRFGAPGGEPFGGPSERSGGTYGAKRPEPGADHTAAFPPPGQSPPPWGANAGTGSGPSDPEQGRFDSFKPVAEPAPETPVPKVRNGRVLAAVLVAAVLILAIPLGLLLLLGKIGGSNEAGAFDPAVGTCVKRSGNSAVEAQCGDNEAFTVVSKVETKDSCPDPTMPLVELRGVSSNPFLCLKPATGS
ncbi:LppU/SCO3897 family protein [Verrucosispora sp. NA02020]|uniref:LppU/SCO3897 family protein n=1 Tax=Verrucosispora sp. NA02020 TaxID=2742132 RepID=UPI003D73AB22